MVYSVYLVHTVVPYLIATPHIPDGQIDPAIVYGLNVEAYRGDGRYYFAKSG
jgi:hypothetical protein